MGGGGALLQVVFRSPIQKAPSGLRVSAFMVPVFGLVGLGFKVLGSDLRVLWVVFSKCPSRLYEEHGQRYCYSYPYCVLLLAMEEVTAQFSLASWPSAKLC